MPTPDREGLPSLADIEAAARALENRIIRTPNVALASDRIAPALPAGAEVTAKLELFQHAGSFKVRGVLLNIDALTADERARGVTGVSAGNHALAVAWAAAREGVSAKLVMPAHVDPVRIRGCEAYGAEVVLVPDVHQAFGEMDRIVSEEGRAAIHPFEGWNVTRGTATVGLELANDVEHLDAVVVPVGGGGLISGVSRAFKLLMPDCRVIGVEPYGADSLTQSLAKGEPVTLDRVDTIADSLGSPKAMPYSFAIAEQHVDQMVRISDEDMLIAMVRLYDALKIAPEPACAAATAAVCGPLKDQLAGHRVGVIACGSNIGESQFEAYVQRGRALVEGSG